MKILRAILPLGNRKGWKQLKVRGQKKFILCYFAEYKFLLGCFLQYFEKASSIACHLVVATTGTVNDKTIPCLSKPRTVTWNVLEFSMIEYFKG